MLPSGRSAARCSSALTLFQNPQLTCLGATQTHSGRGGYWSRSTPQILQRAERVHWVSWRLLKRPSSCPFVSLGGSSTVFARRVLRRA